MDIKLAISSKNGNENKPGTLHLSPQKISKEVQLPNFRSPRSPPPRLTEVESVKCVIVGDAQVGKTSLVTSFLFEEFNKNYISTVRDDYTFCTTMPLLSGQTGDRSVDVDLDISDTGGQTYLDRLRPLCYGDGLTSTTDVAIICFSVVAPSSFMNVTKRWVPELKRHCHNFNKNNMKTILVGTQSDLRSNVNILLQLMEDGLSPISETRAMRLAKKIGALKYIECSSFTGYNVKRVFETAIYSNVVIVPSKSNNIALSKPNLAELSPPQPLRLVENKQLVTSSGGGQGVVRSMKLNSNDPKLFWRRWRLRQKSNKIKRLMLSCLH